MNFFPRLAGSVFRAGIPLVAFLSSASAQPQVLRVERLGLYDPLHTDSYGASYNFSAGYSSDGRSAGSASRFTDGHEDGTTAWYYDGSSTRPLSFPEGAPGSARITDSGLVIGSSGGAWIFDGNVITPIGLAWSSPPDALAPTDSVRFVNTAGQILGITESYTSAGFLKQDAWLYDGASTTQIGLSGPDYTSSDGSRTTSLVSLNEASQAIGYTARNGGDSPGGFASWLFNGTSTVEIAPTGAEFQRSDGRRSSFVSYLTNAGQAVGTAERYNGAASAGFAAWLYQDGDTRVISPTSLEFTRADGTRVAGVTNTNEAGLVLGTATRYDGLDFRGRDSLGTGVWLHNGDSLKTIGLTGGQYTRSDGYQNSSAHLLNQAGHVVGYSDSFYPSSGYGRTAWLYDGVSTIAIGPTGPAFVGANGQSFSEALTVNEASQAIGYAFRYNPAQPDSIDRVGWFYDGQHTVAIALEDAIHRNLDGSVYSEARMLTEGGLVAGYSLRYNHYNGGQTAWIWDRFATPGQELITFDFNVPGNNGYNFSEILFLNDAGFAFGYYTIRDEVIRSDSYRAFGWFRDYGVFDFNTLVDPEWMAGLDLSYFDYVRDAWLLDNGTLSVLVEAQGDPYGRGVARIDLAFGGPSAVPESSTYGLAGALLAVVAGIVRIRARRNKN